MSYFESLNFVIEDGEVSCITDMDNDFDNTDHEFTVSTKNYEASVWCDTCGGYMYRDGDYFICPDCNNHILEDDLLHLEKMG